MGLAWGNSNTKVPEWQLEVVSKEWRGERE